MRFVSFFSTFHDSLHTGISRLVFIGTRKCIYFNVVISTTVCCVYVYNCFVEFRLLNKNRKTITRRTTRYLLTFGFARGQNLSTVSASIRVSSLAPFVAAMIRSVQPPSSGHSSVILLGVVFTRMAFTINIQLLLTTNCTYDCAR